MYGRFSRIFGQVLTPEIMTDTLGTMIPEGRTAVIKDMATATADMVITAGPAAVTAGMARTGDMTEDNIGASKLTRSTPHTGIEE